jgi:glycosyltransferase involved in cell wall biosynthesis
VNRKVSVSVITPFLNAERFIAESIESVLAQTRDDWDLLLVDDGSTDGSAAIARRYAAAHPAAIRYLAHPGGGNHGASASRNLGARHASGEYLAYLDADDVYLPGKLEGQVPLLDSNPDVAMVYAATEYWHGWTGRAADARHDWTWRKYGVPPGTVIEPPRMLIAFLEDGGTVPCLGSVLARRTAVERVGGWEESFRTICTDQVFHAKMCLHGAVLIADECWDRYRQRRDSSSRTNGRAELDAAFDRYLTWLEEYLARAAVVDPAVWRALRHAQEQHEEAKYLARRNARLRPLLRVSRAVRRSLSRSRQRTLPD